MSVTCQITHACKIKFFFYEYVIYMEKWYAKIKNKGPLKGCFFIEWSVDLLVFFSELHGHKIEQYPHATKSRLGTHCFYIYRAVKAFWLKRGNVYGWFTQTYLYVLHCRCKWVWSCFTKLDNNRVFVVISFCEQNILDPMFLYIHRSVLLLWTQIILQSESTWADHSRINIRPKLIWQSCWY